MKSANGFAVADAFGELTNTAGATAGSPLVVAAAGRAVVDEAPSSRRVTAAAVHINAAAPGTSPLPSAPSQDSKFESTPDTAPRGVAAAITGAAAAAGAVGTATTVAADAAEVEEEELFDDVAADGEVAAGRGVTGSASDDTEIRGATGSGVGPAVDVPPADEPLMTPAVRSGPAGGCAGSPTPRRAVALADGATFESPFPLTSAGGDVVSRPDPRAARVGAEPPAAAAGESADGATRAPPRTEPACVPELVEPRDAESEDPLSGEPVEPPEPAVSAYARAGIAATAAPMPSAIASAPTRPT